MVAWSLLLSLSSLPSSLSSPAQLNLCARLPTPYHTAIYLSWLAYTAVAPMQAYVVVALSSLRP